MKHTGPTKKSTRLLVHRLKKASNERKQRIWKRVAESLNVPRRKRASISLQKLSRLSKRFKGKILLVPGKVLGQGPLETSVHTSALEYSTSAKKKILGHKGSCLTLTALLEKNEKPANIIIVK